MKKEDFEIMPMFTVFRGPVELDDQDLLTNDEWDLFGIDGGRVADANVREEANRRGIQLAWNIEGMLMEPEYDHDCAPKGADDHDAALSYIASGGMLVKPPGTMGSKYWRLYPVVLYKPRGTDKTEPAPPPFDVQPSSQN